MKHKRNQQGFHHIVLFLAIAVLAVVGFVGWRVFSNQKGGGGAPSEILNSSDSAKDKAIAAGKYLSHNRCEGTEKLTLTHLPMKEEDFSILIPYGLVIGGHVTPIDHQYFSPADYKSPRDAYPVYAMADAVVTEIQPRTNDRGTEYRMVFTHSCTSLYYYDLVTSLTGKVKEAYDKNPKDINLPVKAGEQIGKIGGQTLDFAVWDTEKPLTGFVNPASYDGEAWKIYTADPYPYYTPPLRQLLTERNPRTAEPIAGKIDYDIDGKLIGNWFEKDSGGYRDFKNTAMEYWGGHLSIAPDMYDPLVIVISVGNYDSYPKYGSNLDTTTGDGSSARQYYAKAGGPDPAKVDPTSGLVKYELVQRRYITPSGEYWNNMDLIKGPKAVNTGSAVIGTILLQLTGQRTLKVEVFPGKTAGQVSAFGAQAKTYER